MIAVDMARDVPVGGILGKQKEKGALQSSSSSFSFSGSPFIFARNLKNKNPFRLF
jgi:hypothetical protein